MIITHTQNASGQRRVYLGAKSSLECWVEPAADNIAWSFHTDTAPSSYPPPPENLREWAKHMLLALADELRVEPADLAAVPFERIAALHATNPMEYRRVALPRRQPIENGFMATLPTITRPQADFTGQDFAQAQQRRR
jgi:hypothetical protein